MGFDYKAVLDAQCSLLERYGLRKSSEQQVEPVHLYELVNLLSYDREVGRAWHVDAGGRAGTVLSGVEHVGSRMSFFGCTDSDIDGRTRIDVVPDRAFVVVAPDPRESFAALFNRPESYHGGIVDKGGVVTVDGKQCVLFYPDASLLRASAHKHFALEALCLYEPPEPKYVGERPSEKLWLESVKDYVCRTVVEGVRDEFSSAKLSGFDFDSVAPRQGGGVTYTNFPIVRFRVKGVKRQNLERVASCIDLVFEKSVPFPHWFDYDVNKKKLHASVMLELPEQPF